MVSIKPNFMKKAVDVPVEHTPAWEWAERQTDTLQGSRDVNIILAVKEHAPVRVTQIQKEIETKQKQIQLLEAEKNTLEKLIAVVDATQTIS